VQFPDPYLVMRAAAQRGLTARLLELGIVGGAVYDAVVALTAAGAGATLVSCDRRAATTYERCGVETRLVG
jgi:predicted nucleic acid-binding protein